MMRPAVVAAAALLSISVPASAQDEAFEDLLGITPAASEGAAPASTDAVPGDASGQAPAAEAVDSIPVGDTPMPTDTIRRPSSRLVEEIVVTAQKREENLQEVPIAISAFSAEKLDAFGIQSAQELDRVTPGLTISSSVGFTLAYLRGVGTDAFLPGADPSVPFYLDGVPLITAQGSADTLGRIDRIEVLKGPQGTLFGRNATGGAISIITPNPGDEVSGDLKVELGQYNASNIVGYLSTPIVDGLGISLAGYSSQRDNYYVNELGPVIDIYSRGGRAKLRWEVSDTFFLTATGSYQELSTNAGLTFETTRPAAILGLPLPADPAADRRIRSDTLSGATNEGTMFALTAEWLLPWTDVKFIGSDQRLEAPFVVADLDGTEVPLANVNSLSQVTKQRTAELQFLSNSESPFSDRFQWVAGLFYLESSGGFNPIAFDLAPQLLTRILPNGGASLSSLLNGVLGVLNLPPLFDTVRLLNYGVLESQSYSVFAQGTFNATDTVDLTLGLRYQHEERNLVGARTTFPLANGTEVPLFPLIGGSYDLPELEAKQLSPRVALQWRPFDSPTQIYTSWSRAYKSPTYNTVHLLGELLGPIEPVREEKVDSFELGIKTDLFDDTLRLNAATFYTKQKDLLTGFVAVLSGGVVTYDNAGNAEIFGAEADAIWTPMPELNPGLALVGAVSWLDSEYTHYPDGRGYDETSGLAFGPGILPLGAPRDFSGNRIVRTPEWTYTLGLNQRIEVGQGSAVEVGIDTYYNSGFFFLPQNSELYKRGAYQTWSARVSYFYEPWNLQLTVFGQNLTDELYNEGLFVSDFGMNQVMSDPRVIGMRMNWSF